MKIEKRKLEWLFLLAFFCCSVPQFCDGDETITEGGPTRNHHHHHRPPPTAGVHRIIINSHYLRTKIRTPRKNLVYVLEFLCVSPSIFYLPPGKHSFLVTDSLEDIELYTLLALKEGGV
ncbi:unnamed protein product [Lactuca saligna]|uniref:Uncharacterized protein n=1 Tax=Lactuca saligna TaxID=75948 RepID=A0AA35YTB3_LACSI|nr:unnamed protein product [Lactuca saligna]